MDSEITISDRTVQHVLNPGTCWDRWGRPPALLRCGHDVLISHCVNKDIMLPVFVEKQILRFEKRSDEKTLLRKSATSSSAARCAQPVARLRVGPARRGARAGCPDQIDYAEVCHKMCSLRFPAGRHMKCTALRPLPNPRPTVVHERLQVLYA
jgi:hypothetical protein